MGDSDTRSFLGVDHSVGGYRWVDRLGVREQGLATAIAQRSGLPDIVARILAGRGVEPDAVEGFLDPTLRALMPDPSVMTEMDAAAERIATAIVGGEKVAVFGDYDVDGASSAALLKRFLAHQGNDARIYIPDRIFEGYGPNPEAIRALISDGVQLIITVDCGATSFEALAEARRMGGDVVVLDHHETGEELPAVVAVVDPNRQDDLSQLGHLAAVGVVFMTVVAVNRLLRQRNWYGLSGRKEPDLLQWTDLVALGTVCDVVPLVGLNRAFVVKGLAIMSRRANLGIAALADVSRLGGPITPYHLGFILGPRINAGGRIGDAALGARLLSSEDPVECEHIAVDLNRLNQERREQEAAMLEQAFAEVDAEVEQGGGPAVLLTAHERWHPGIVGLVASRLKDRFRRPVIAVALQPNGMGTGSARSVVGYDIGRVVRQAADKGILVKGGGHPMAAGLTVEASRLAELRAFLAESSAGFASPDRHDLAIDAAMTARGATAALVADMERAGPYGAGHPEPLLALPDHRLSYVENTAHGHVRMAWSGGDGATLRGIAFRAADTDLGRALLAGRNSSFHVAGHVTLDRWQGRTSLSFRVRDVAPTGRI